MEFASVTKESIPEARHVSGCPWIEIYREAIAWSCEVEAWIALEIPRYEDARVMGYLPRKAANRDGTNPRKRSVLQPTKLKGIGDLKSTLTSDMELQSLEFAQLAFDLALVLYFLSMLPSRLSGTVMCIQCHYVLESMWSAFLFFGGFQLRNCMNLRRHFELQTFK